MSFLRKRVKGRYGWSEPVIINPSTYLHVPDDEDNLSARLARRASRTREQIVERLILAAKCRAKRNELPFDLDISDLLPLPDRCPALGIQLLYGVVNGPQDNRASLDKFNPYLGYVRGNVNVISFRANNLKKNYTIAEFERSLIRRKQASGKIDEELRLLWEWCLKQ